MISIVCLSSFEFLHLLHWKRYFVDFHQDFEFVKLLHLCSKEVTISTIWLVNIL